MYSVSSLPGHPQRVRQRRRCCRITVETRCAVYCTAVASNPFSNAAEVRDDVYCFLYPEEYALPEKNESESHSSTSDEEELEEE